MSNREKLLGIATGGLLLVIALYGVYSMVSSRIEDRHGEIANLNSEFRKKNLEKEKGKRAQKLIYEFQKRSLHVDPDRANLEFVHWLQMQVKSVGITEESVRYLGYANTKKPYKELTYNVSGVGDIKQLTQFLYNLHSADNLQRVRSVSVRKQKNSKKLKLDFVVDALSMEAIDAKSLEKQLGTPIAPDRVAELTTKNAVGTMDPTKMAHTLSEYEAKIGGRNSFSPANLPPELTSSKRQEVELGKRLSVNLEAKDPENHDVIFEIDEDAPEDMEISEKGKLTWRPKELGEYQFFVYVKDTGIPSKEIKETIKVKVIPEPEKEPEQKEDPFDEAKLAVLTAIVQGPKSPEPQMCMYLRSEDEYQYLAAGDDIEIGKWSGVVVSVEPDRSLARIQTDKGDYVLTLGQALADAKFVKAESKDRKKDSEQL